MQVSQLNRWKWQREIILDPTFTLLYPLLKGTVQRDFNSVFWHIWTGLDLNMNCFWFYYFSGAPNNFLYIKDDFLREDNKNLSERLYFSDNFYKFISGFLCFWDVLIGQNHFEKQLLIL
jgi:hypothetical protein